jgi:battenin
MPEPVNPLVFWVLGVLNNASYIIMLASAKSISEGGTALVFIANIIPAVIIKSSAPYWFDRVSYDTRITAGAILMATSFSTVAFFQESHSQYALYFELLGVSLISAQTGMGEASLLALAGASDAPRNKPACLTCFASGTGLAGIVGFLFKYTLNSLLRFSMRATLLSAISLAVMYFSVYRQYLWGRKKARGELSSCSSSTSEDAVDDDELMNGYEPSVIVPMSHDGIPQEIFEDESQHPSVMKVQDMNTYQRLQLTLSLYPYIIPLFLVYAAEYTMQAGTWTAIGFPVTDMKARNDFYFAANWTYFVGVFLSRSSGTLFTAPMWLLWLMPILQCVNVGFYWVVAVHHVFYNWWLLVGCFYSGLLGGAVYVHGFARICKDLPKEHTEFALSATSVGECLGILAADITGLFVQSCLYAINGLSGAAVVCPFIDSAN